MAIISKGNTKVGKVGNISLTPISSCVGCGHICGKDCYAMRSYRQYPQVRAAWDANYHQAVENLAGYFEDVLKALNKYKGEFFRWHVGGDIISFKYFNMMVRVAVMFPHIKFLCFTKQYTIVNLWSTDSNGWKQQPIPSNLQVVFSAWPGLEMKNPFLFPVAYMDDGTETRLTGTEIPCAGSCENCGMCWSLSSIGRNVVFKKH